METDIFETAEELLNLKKEIGTTKNEIVQLYSIMRNHAGEGISGNCKEIIEKLNSKLEDLFIDYDNVSKDTKSLEKIIFIPCQITLENTNDIQEIKKNKSEVFNWLVKGVKEIIKTKKIYISKECEDFKERFNFVNLFVNETNLIKTENNSKSIVTTYENVLKQYELFCELYDEEPLGRGYFNRELKALGFEATRRETGNVWFAKFA